MWIVAIEGAPDSSAPAIWGTPIIEDSDGRKWNPLSGRVISDSHYDDLILREFVTPLARTIELQDDGDFPKVIVRLSRKAVSYDIAERLFRKADWSVRASKQVEYHYFVYRDEEIFADKVKDVTDRLAYDLLKEIKNDANELTVFLPKIKLGLIFDNYHPALNALRVYCAHSSEPSIEKVISRKMEKAQDRNPVFLKLLKIFRIGEISHTTILKGGIAKSKGLNVRDAIRYLQSYDDLHDVIYDHIKQEMPYIPPSESIQLREMDPAASVLLKFSSKVEDQTLGDKVSRILELEMFEKILDGRMPPDLVDSLQASRSIHVIVRPDKDTEVKHIPIGGSDFRSVVVSEVKYSIGTESDPFDVFGVQSGVSNEVKSAEFLLLNGFRIRVSTRNDGHGNKPEGVDYIRTGNDFLFSPYILTITRSFTDKGKAKYNLKKIVSVNAAGSGKISGIPSTVFYGAFIIGEDLNLSVSDYRLKFDGIGEFNLPRSSYESFEVWMKEYTSKCLKFELENLKSERIHPTQQRPVKIFEKALIALDADPSIDSFEKLSRVMSTVYHGYVSAVSVAVAIKMDSSNLFVVSEENRPSVTAKGKAYADLLKEVGPLCLSESPRQLL